MMRRWPGGVGAVQVGGRALIKFGEYVCPPVAMSKKALQDGADSLVVKHWNQIEALAKELMSKGEVQGPEAVRIIESSIK